jgi:hypothetical protein
MNPILDHIEETNKQSDGKYWQRYLYDETGDYHKLIQLRNARSYILFSIEIKEGYLEIRSFQGSRKELKGTIADEIPLSDPELFKKATQIIKDEQ